MGNTCRGSCNIRMTHTFKFDSVLTLIHLEGTGPTRIYFYFAIEKWLTTPVLNKRSFTEKSMCTKYDRNIGSSIENSYDNMVV